MLKELLFILVFSMILLPFHFAYADDENPWDPLGLTDIFNLNNFMSNLQNIDEMSKSDITEKFLEIQKSPNEIGKYVSDNPEHFKNVNQLIQTKLDYAMEQTNNMENTDVDVNELTNQLNEIGTTSLTLYVSINDFQNCNSDIPNNDLVEFLDSVQVSHNSYRMSLKDHMDSIENVPKMDEACNKYDELLNVYYDSGYLYQIPLIPDSENNLISISAYCAKKLDEKRCEILMKIGIAAQLTAKNDPNAIREASKVLLIITKNMNHQYYTEQDLEKIEPWLDLTYYDLIEIKFVELSNGETKSLNEISKIQCDDDLYVLQSTIEHLDSTNTKLELIQQDVDWIANNVDAIKNNQCSVELTKINKLTN